MARDNKGKSLSEAIPADRVIRVLCWSMAAGVAVTALYALQGAVAGQFFAVFSIALAVAGAASITGALLGFIFGIPRALQGSDAGGKGGETGGAQPANKEKRRDASYGANTSLEQISDWLTKILVGVGLTQLTNLPDALRSFSGFIGAAFGEGAGSTVFAGAVSLYFVVCGFLVSYLWTRLTLGHAFSEADLVTRAELEQLKEDNARALRLAERQLEKGSEPPAAAELVRAIGEADDLYRSHIYERAKEQRISGHDKKDAESIARTVPIFRALIQRNPSSFHQTHGQLGLALLDLDPPDYAGCESSLTRAIEMRGPWEKYGFWAYELVRALCRIRRSMDGPGRIRKADPVEREQIMRDLRVAREWPFARLEDATQADIRAWLDANHVKLEDIP
jgi:hypothetical protein